MLSAKKDMLRHTEQALDRERNATSARTNLLTLQVLTKHYAVFVLVTYQLQLRSVSLIKGAASTAMYFEFTHHLQNPPIYIPLSPSVRG